MSLYTNFACFNCRKSFRNFPIRSQEREERKCPICPHYTIDMGIYFEPPRQRAKKQWSVMEFLAKNGYRFATEGSKVYLDRYILCAKNPSLKQVILTVNCEWQKQEEFQIKSRVKRYKQDKKQRSKNRTILNPNRKISF